jgi:hypothetical protein
VLQPRLENSSERTVGVAAEIRKYVREDSRCCIRDYKISQRGQLVVQPRLENS